MSDVAFWGTRPVMFGAKMMLARKLHFAALAAAGVLIAAEAFLAGRAAYAINGEEPATVGAFSVPSASCSSLRTRTGVQGDVLFACDPNGEACEIALPSQNREQRS